MASLRNNKNAQIKEIIKCGKDPIYFFNQYVKIQHPVQGVDDGQSGKGYSSIDDK